ncbi:MAG: DHH family phosphoesterase [Clostridia bacterium]|nr:DHH family phosphoesterase [Clostridia bacterium]
MKKKSIFRVLPVINILIVLTVVLAGVSYFFDIRLFAVEMIVAVAVCGYAVMKMLSLQKDIYNYFTQVSKSLEENGSASLAEFVMPIMITKDTGEIVWYNENFRTSVLKGKDIYGEEQNVIFSEGALKQLEDEKHADVDYNDRKYVVFEYRTNVEGIKQKIYFFYDETGLIKISEKYKKTRPCVMYIQADNLDIMLKDALESEKATVIGAIEREIETLVNFSDGFFQKISSDKYVLIIEKSGFDRIIEDKFSVLRTVRALDFGNRGNVSLSIGVGRDGESIGECVELASQALDMAQGRGGDQAVIKTKDGFEFYGGVTQAAQRNSRVRTRVVAATLNKLIESSDNVLIMGHSYSDMDSFGAAFALWRAVTELKKPAKIVVDRKKTLALPLISMVAAGDMGDIMAPPSEAVKLVNKRTLLIIVDTHRASFVESKEVYEKAAATVIIDHHRKTVDYIDNALLFYHDPSASSACEMVSELLQYMGPKLIGKTEAEALLSGIMLDTRNFVLRTGVRTFEASAFLRSRGANPVEVKKLFSGSMDTYKERSAIVAQAEVFKDCAISLCEETGDNIRIASSQAADELLSISDVNASFVLFADADAINISARSLGAVNVQLVMEQLGGGGHQTMAAAQLENETFEGAKNLLLKAITKVKEG